MHKRFSLLCLGLLFIGGCGQAEPAPGEAFLATLFTTNQNGRWDAVQSAEPERMDGALEAYLAPFADLCTESGLASLAANRFPARFDALAEESGCAFAPEAIAVSEPDAEGAADFSVTVSVSINGKPLGTATQTGQLVFQTVKGGTLVDSLWMGDLSDVYGLLEEAKE